MSLIEDIDYIDADVAYLLGLITARGRISDIGGVKQIAIECKNTTLSLSHLSQLLGYSRISRPLLSFLISPMGFSTTLVSLLKDYHRQDVLEYYWDDGKLPRQLILAQWDKSSLNLNRNTMIGGMGI